METLRFLMVSTHFPPLHLGGDAIFVDYLSRELIKRGHEVDVLHSPAAYELLRKRTAAPPAKALEGGPTVHHFTSRLGRMSPLMALTLGRWSQAERALRQLADRLKPDVVHWHNTRGFIGRPFPIAGALSLYTVHDYTPVCPRSTLLRPSMRVCEEPVLCTVCCMRWRKPPQLWRTGGRRVLRYHPDLKLLSPSEFVAKQLAEDGVTVHRVLRGFVPDLAQTYGLSESVDESIVYLGLLEKHKGVEVLLDAFIRTRNEQGFRLRILGEGTLRTKLRLTANQSGVSDRVETPGFLPRKEVEQLRRNAVAQIVPSTWYENAPSTALEAYSLGVPVVASDIGGLPEIVDASAGSKIFRPGDSRQLGEILVSLWNDRGSMAEAKRKARRAYETRFRPDIHVDEYLKLVKESVS